MLLSSNDIYWGNPCVVVANVFDFDIIVNEFELKSRYNVHFWSNTIGKYIKSLIQPPVMSEIASPQHFEPNSFGIE